MKVIVAGMPKTGTKSMNAALKTLGYSVYDFPENAFLLTSEYEKIVSQGWETDDWRRMYENIDAIVDFPAFYFWDEIHKAFPDAKIILTMRDGEDEWLRSFENQVQKMDVSPFFRLMRFLSPTAVKSIDFLRMLGQITFGIKPQAAFRKKTVFNKQLAKKHYRQHNAYVMHSAPKDKLLVYKCSEGWIPLCKFLGVPVPDEPFPHKNKGGKFAETAAQEFPIFRKIRREMILSSVVYTSFIVIGGVCAYKYGLSTSCHYAGSCVDQAMQKIGLLLH